VVGTGGAEGGGGDGPEAAVGYVDDGDGEGSARGELEEPSLVRDGAVGLKQERERVLAAVGDAHRRVEHHVLGAVNEAHVAHRLARVPAGLQRAEDQALHAHAVDPQDLSHPMMR
jgi:hypothetical protein